MGAIEFYYLQAPMAVGLLATLGATVIALRQPNYRASRACAWIATGLFMSMAIVWGSTTKSSPWVWVPMIAIIGAMGSVGLVAALRSISSAEAQNSNPPPEAKKDSVMSGGVNVTGNNNILNLGDGSQANQNQQKPPEVKNDGNIYQAGVVVGRAFGARRLPNDATKFEFVEILNCGQWNPGAPFLYDGVRLQFISEQDSALMVMGRAQDSPMRMGVIARVVD